MLTAHRAQEERNLDPHTTKRREAVLSGQEGRLPGSGSASPPTSLGQVLHPVPPLRGLGVKIKRDDALHKEPGAQYRLAPSVAERKKLTQAAAPWERARLGIHTDPRSGAAVMPGAQSPQSGMTAPSQGLRGLRMAGWARAASSPTGASTSPGSRHRFRPRPAGKAREDAFARASGPARAPASGALPGAAHAHSPGAFPAAPPGAPAPPRVTGRAPTHAPPAARTRTRPPSRARLPPPRPPPRPQPGALRRAPTRPQAHAPRPRALPSPPRSRGRRAALLLLSPPSRMVAAAAAATQTLGSGGRAPRPEVTFLAASARAAPPSPSHPTSSLHLVLAALGRRARRPPSCRPPPSSMDRRPGLGPLAGDFRVSREVPPAPTPGSRACAFDSRR
ncbi:skin secretory protein xP2-like [Balaenoptera acutorostrata]|uniref:Skin secretory protein xP2-like n=1 Tax=Balaenoptera acutorostrata TaxID=9767 RepID=A0ABM3SIR0_BALAC|nr:skin secretory protein xP2-like [Balaenoptera acutorostrata]